MSITGPPQHTQAALPAAACARGQVVRDAYPPAQATGDAAVPKPGRCTRCGAAQTQARRLLSGRTGWGARPAAAGSQAERRRMRSRRARSRRPNSPHGRSPQRSSHSCRAGTHHFLLLVGRGRRRCRRRRVCALDGGSDRILGGGVRLSRRLHAGGPRAGVRRAWGRTGRARAGRPPGPEIGPTDDCTSVEHTCAAHVAASASCVEGPMMAAFGDGCVLRYACLVRYARASAGWQGWRYLEQRALAGGVLVVIRRLPCASELSSAI